jgi:hypothetical protein
MIKTLGQTINFTVQYEDTFPNAIKRAQVLLNTIENEFIVLTSWFGVVGGFGPGNRSRIIVDLENNTGGNNRGYHTDGTIEIHIDTQNNNPNDTNAGEIVKMVFVAEFAEVLMAYVKNWDRGASTGEGLSHFCARERFTKTYDNYWDNEVGRWFNSGFENWIDNTEATDQNKVSYGCALLFLYYLKSQRNFSIPEIIKKGGPTLEITFQNLTGESGGLVTIVSLLNHFYPNSSLSAVQNANPFPLLEPAERQVMISTSIHSRMSNRRIPVLSGSARESFLGCAEKEYSFEILPMYPELTCTAHSIGFGQPVYRWFVNGVLLPAYFPKTVQCQATIIRDNPADPLTASSSIEMIDVEFSLLPDQFFQRSVVIYVPNIIGHIDLTIRVEGHDQNFMPDSLNAAETRILLATEKIVWEDSFYEDARHCRDRFINSLREIAPLFRIFRREIAIIFTLPDPAPGNPISLQQLERQFKFLDQAQKYLPIEMIHQLENHIMRQFKGMPHLAARLSRKSY